MAWKLPVGVQDFAQLREGDFLYADKTQQIHRLVTTGVAYFLSRPRRFGKSLLLSTIKELYEGNRRLFAGLWIENQWNWDKRHPVVRISLGTGRYREAGGTRAAMDRELSREIQRLRVQVPEAVPWDRFAILLDRLSERGPRPVVLIDEYDKPVLQVLETDGDRTLLEENRRDLRALYSCLKDAAPEFLLLTGVSRLAKASVFSEMNQLRDITWDLDYATICGLTREDIATTFAEPLATLAANHKLGVPATIDRLQDRYNGFRFACGAETVFNPFSTLTTLASRQFGSYWTETGTPEFLVRLMQGSGTTLRDVDGVSLPMSALSSLDPLKPRALPLLLQTGYLTITGHDDENLILGFPNVEVRSAFVEHLLSVATDTGPDAVAPRAQSMGKALRAGDLDRFLREMQWVFTTIPYQLDDATEARYHGLFHAMAMLACSPPGLVLAETPNALGRSDLVVDLPDATWIFEFKRDDDPAEALAQIRHKAYARPWHGRGKPVHLVGVTFGTAKRNLVAWQRIAAD
jgi:hypothetical protein